MMTSRNAQFRFYAELNDFLDEEKQKRSFVYTFKGNPAIKDAIEAIGAPHTEVDLILVNGVSVGFGYQLQAGDRVSVYPVFESLDITPVAKLRREPLREPCFILDVHLGKLAKLLRLLGFDARYSNDYEDDAIVACAVREKRIVLTRDLGILKTSAVTHGYWVRSRDPIEQVREVLRRFDLYKRLRPFQRCMTCNGRLERVDRAAVVSRVPPQVAAQYQDFFVCAACGKVYWRGSHYERLRQKIDKIVDDD